MGGESCTDRIRDLAYQVGSLVAQRGGIVLCGGGEGVMEAVCHGARDYGGTTIGIMPGSNPAESLPNQYVDIPIFTGMSDGRNSINIKSSEVVIAIDGSYGTLSEIGMALKNGRHVVGLLTWEPRIGGELPAGLVAASDPEDAVEIAFQYLESRE